MTIVLLAFTCADASGAKKPRVIVQPEDQMHHRTVTKAIREAHHSIDIVIYDLGAQDILEALQVARKKLARNHSGAPSIRIMINPQWFNPFSAQYQATYWALMMEQLEVDLDTGRSKDGVVQFNYAANNFQITHQKTLLIDARRKDGSEYENSRQVPESATAIIATFNLQANDWPKTWNGDPKGRNCPDNPSCSFATGTRDFGVILKDRSQIWEIERVFSSDFNEPSAYEANLDLGLNDPMHALVWSNGTLGITAPPPTGFGKIFAPGASAYPAFSDFGSGSGFYPYPVSALYEDNQKDPEQVHPGTIAGNARAIFLQEIAKAASAARKGEHPRLLIYNEEYQDPLLLAAIRDAAALGVQIRILMTFNNINGPEYQRLVTTRTLSGQPVDAAIHLYPDTAEYLYLHAKMLYLDLEGQRNDEIIISSQNFSQTSLEQNRELGIRLGRSWGNLSPKAAGKLLTTFEKDFSYEGKELNSCPVVAITPAQTWNDQIAQLNPQNGCKAIAGIQSNQRHAGLNRKSSPSYFPAPLLGVQNSFQPPLPQGPIKGFIPPQCMVIESNGRFSPCPP